MTFLEWILALAHTGFLSWCGGITAVVTVALIGRNQGIEHLPVLFWSFLAGAGIGFVTALRLVWGADLLPWL